AAQTLDQAVARQLQADADNRCVVLLGGDVNQIDPNTFLNPVLTGPLQRLCAPGVPGASTTGASSSAGGGGATSTTLPRIVEKRLREKRGEKEEEKGAVSADTVTRWIRGVNLFFSGEYEDLEREVTTFEDGYESDIWRLAVGADRQFTDWLMAGLAFDYYRHDGDFVGGGGFETYSYGLLAFANLSPWDRSFIQLSGGWARKDYERKRFTSFVQPFDGASDESVQGFVEGGYAGDEFRAGILSGYDFTWNEFRIQPRAGLDWVRNDFDTYREHGNTGLELTFHENDEDWLQSTVGIKGAMNISTGFGVLVPQVSFDWKHEFKDDQRSLAVSFVGDTRAKRFTYLDEAPERNFYVVNAGVSTVLPHGIQAFVNYRALVGHSFLEGHAGTIGMRIEF
ncbi:MAG: autotransporter outer membrane beta-barrel domain-containing protein, partial [Gammaproteobacteria bacterium]